MRFSKEEDVALTQAWIEAKNNILNRAQDTDTQLWSNFFEYFGNISGNPNARVKAGLRARWGKINGDIITFVTIQAEVNIRNPEMSYEQRKSAARLDYLNQTGDNFPHDECYQLLKETFDTYNSDEM